MFETMLVCMGALIVSLMAVGGLDTQTLAWLSGVGFSLSGGILWWMRLVE